MLFIIMLNFGWFYNKVIANICIMMQLKFSFFPRFGENT